MMAGSRRQICDGWANPCDHIDKYAAVREEALSNGLNDAAKVRMLDHDEINQRYDHENWVLKPEKDGGRRKMKKGDWVQFRMDWGKPAVLHDLGRITRVARDGSWADVETRYGRKRIPNPSEYLRFFKTVK